MYSQFHKIQILEIPKKFSIQVNKKNLMSQNKISEPLSPILQQIELHLNKINNLYLQWSSFLQADISYYEKITKNLQNFSNIITKTMGSKYTNKPLFFQPVGLIFGRFLTLQPHIDDDDDYDQRSNVTTKAPAVNQTAPINPVKVLPKIKFTPPKIQSSLSTKAIPSKNSQSRSNNENPTSPAKSGPPSLSHPKIGPPKVGPSSNGSKSIAPPPLGSTSK